MKTLIITFALGIISQISYAQIVQHNEQSLDDDLNFKHSKSEEVKQRNVASDKNLEETEDQDRGVASDKENQESKIQYWKY